MPTTGKVPFLGFKAGAVKFLALLGFSPGSAADTTLAFNAVVGTFVVSATVVGTSVASATIVGTVATSATIVGVRDGG